MIFFLIEMKIQEPANNLYLLRRKKTILWGLL